MRKILLSIVAIATLFITSCGSENSTESTSEDIMITDSISAVVCEFTYDSSSTKVTWTSFKTSAKVAVGGGFDVFNVTNTAPSNSESAVFENATFSIVTGSVNTGNVERDPKLITFFFNSMIQSDTITGGVKKISEAVNGKGAAIIFIKMNGIQRDVNATYTLLGTELTLKATINVNNWEAENAITSLNTECKELHTGDDGISKLWSEVNIQIFTDLDKSCN